MILHENVCPHTIWLKAKLPKPELGYELFMLT